MSDKLTIDQLRKCLEDSSYRLQTLAEQNLVDPATYRLFDNLSREHHCMFSYIIDYLDQNQ